MYPGARVKWAGKQDPRVAPGFNGTVMRVSKIDPDSFKVKWDERGPHLGKHTWERRKNLELASPLVADGAGSQAG